MIRQLNTQKDLIPNIFSIKAAAVGQQFWRFEKRRTQKFHHGTGNAI